jgi:hypothetical protein
MGLNNLLGEKKSVILRKWFDVLLQSYPSDTSGFLRNQERQFANPVGYTLSQGLEGLLDELFSTQEMDFPRISPLLDSIIRIRAVQDLTPSQALAFVFHLKRIIQDEVGHLGTAVSGELPALESRIDALALVAFDLYMNCREKIYELKANEVRNRTYRLLQRANLVSDGQEQ